MKIREIKRKNLEFKIILIVSIILTVILTSFMFWYISLPRVKVLDFYIEPKLPEDNFTLYFNWKSNYDSLNIPKYIPSDNDCFDIINYNLTKDIRRNMLNEDTITIKINNNSCEDEQYFSLLLDTGTEVVLESTRININFKKCLLRNFDYVGYNEEEDKPECCIKYGEGYYCELI